MTTLEKFIVLAVVALPFTLLRVGPIGLGEFIFIVFFLTELGKEQFNIYSNNFIFSKFWVAFLSVSLLGFLFNIIFLDHRTGTYAGMFFDFTAYLVIFLACFSLENMRKRTNCDFFKVISAIFYWSAFIFLVLYLLSFLTSSLFGLPLKYYSYFVPMANNLHQISLYLVPLPFLGLIVLKEERNFFRKLVILFLIGMIFVMGFSTGSFKAMIGFVLGLLSYVFLTWFYFFNKRNQVAIISLMSLLGVLVVVYNINFIISAAVSLFIEEDLENGRLHLYSKAIDVMRTSPIIGLGPGPHIWDASQFWDSHQTFFTVMLQSGIIGVFIIGKLFFKITTNLIKNPALFAGLVTIIIYLLGGDIMRRLPTWIILILIFYYQRESTAPTTKTI